MYELERGNVKKEPMRSRTGKTFIGNTTYVVTTHFKETASETAEDKLLTYVINRMSMEMKG